MTRPEVDPEQALGIAERIETLVEAYDQTAPHERSVSLLLDDIRDVIGMKRTSSVERP